MERRFACYKKCLRESPVEFESSGDEDRLREEMEWFRRKIGNVQHFPHLPIFTIFCQKKRAVAWTTRWRKVQRRTDFGGSLNVP